MISAAKPQIESFTDQRWPIPTIAQHRDWLCKQTAFGLFELCAYEYMVHLRHHGFPSPLLDWSQSPYIAAFFAFNDAKLSVERVAVYAYLEYAGSGKLGSRQRASIHTRGPYVSTHRRHFLQRSEYTVCVLNTSDAWRYAPHDEVLSDNEEGQDIIWKFTMPSTERLHALKLLDRFNLNAYSLFGSEESLMQTVALRTFGD